MYKRLLTLTLKAELFQNIEFSFHSYVVKLILNNSLTYDSDVKNLLVKYSIITRYKFNLRSEILIQVIYVV